MFAEELAEKNADLIPLSSDSELSDASSSSSSSSEDEDRRRKKRKEEKKEKKEKEKKERKEKKDRKKKEEEAPAGELNDRPLDLFEEEQQALGYFGRSPASSSSSSSSSSLQKVVGTPTRFPLSVGFNSSLPSPRRFLYSEMEEQEEERVSEVMPPAFFAPYDIRFKRIGETDFVQVFLPSAPYGWDFTFTAPTELKIDFSVRIIFPIDEQSQTEFAAKGFKVDITGMESRRGIRNFSWSLFLPEAYAVDK